MIIYVFCPDTQEVVAEIHGDTNVECERKAAEHGYRDEQYDWTYTPAFGFSGGLVENDGAEIIE
jgi:hypothetical protein